MNKTRSLLATALFGLATIAGTAQADMTATAYIDVTNFVILGSDNEALDFNTDFVSGSLTFTSSADMDGTLTGTAGFSQSDPNSIVNIDFAAECLGSGCPVLAENTYPFITGAQGIDYVTADQSQIGSPIANLPGFSTLGANVGQGAYGSLTDPTTATGSANANNGLEANWQFSLAQDQGISFAGDFRTYLEAFAEAGEVFPGKASAATSFLITITDIDQNSATFGQVIFSFAPDLLNETTSANANNFGVDLQTCGNLAAVLGGCGNTDLAGNFLSTTVALAANNLYQLSIRSNANIDIARQEVVVPEPGMLGLLGLSMMGLFLARRRAS